MPDLYRLAIRKDQAAADALDELAVIRLWPRLYPKGTAPWARYYASAEAYRVAYDAYRAALEL